MFTFKEDKEYADLEDCIDRTLVIALAGGMSTRMGESLSALRVKSSLECAGKFKIIDFIMRNALNSGFKDVLWLTLHQPDSLHHYFMLYYSSLNPLDDLEETRETGHYVRFRTPGDVTRRPVGTLASVRDKMDFISRYEPENVLILAGDQIYNMDYREMLRQHVEQRADLTINVKEFSVYDVINRFGVLEVDEVSENGVLTRRIKQFIEKPQHVGMVPTIPGTDCCYGSTAIILLRYELLKEFIDAGEDFAKDMIPTIIRAGKRVIAHPFGGYWTDIGNPRAYLSANLSILVQDSKFDLNPEGWPMWKHGKGKVTPPNIDFDNHRITLSEEIAPDVEIRNSIIGRGTVVERGARIYNSLIFGGRRMNSREVVHTRIGPDCTVANAIVGRNVEFLPGTVVGVNYEQDKANGLECFEDQAPNIAGLSQIPITTDGHLVVVPDNYEPLKP